MSFLTQHTLGPLKIGDKPVDNCIYPREIAPPSRMDAMSQATVVRESGYTAVAFFVAPLVAALSLAFLGFAQIDGVAQNAVLVLGWTIVFYGYALGATVLIGLPSFLVLRKLGLVQWWSESPRV